MRKLTDEGPEVGNLRRTIQQAVSPSKPTGVLNAFRRSPLVGADLDLTRPCEKGRIISNVIKPQPSESLLAGW
ncbi:hypothetical protein [Bradyrhizobium sp. Ghvi]|uniref:hypothetical protein n=1 Tax=Bradyrhizobium sp. Ghvi TaxID=1855319 RepID=UPI000A4746A2